MTNECEFVTPQEIADRLRVSVTTVYNWLIDGKITGIKYGDVWRVRKEDYDTFIHSGTNTKK